MSTGKALVIHPALRETQKPRATPLGAAIAAETSTVNRRSPEARLAEAAGLAAAIDLDIADAQVLRLNRAVPATLLGPGQIEALAEMIAKQGIDLVIVDHPLTPVQQRNLERGLKAKVIDRTGLILDIFGARARTKEGRLQVELASLTYQRSRLVRSWTHLERQRGGYGFLGGPGESQLEIDRRIITDRITQIRRSLEQVTRTRGLHRKSRDKVPYPTVALVGYTNAGKSTLFNRLTDASVMAKDLLFATLDPTLREITLPSGRSIILSDTVGFISDLPTQLIAAFRATLEEVTGADLIIHVRDSAHPDTEAQRDDVLSVLGALGVGPEADPHLADYVDIPIIEAANKIDLLTEEEKAVLAAQTARKPDGVAVSAVTGEGLPELLERIDAVLGRHRQLVEIDVPLADGAALAFLYRHGEVINRRDDDESAHLAVRLDPEDLSRFEHRFTADSDALA